MFEIQRTSRFLSMCGSHVSGDVRTIDNLFCVRKHMESSHKEWKKFKSIKKDQIFAFVSSPGMPVQQADVLSDIKVWLHPFRKHAEKLHSTSHYVMMPESDFMDEHFVCNGTSSIQYDFFYLTINARAGVKFKGLKEFVAILPTLCGKMKQRGVVVVYFPATGSIKRLSCLDKTELGILAKYAKNIDFVWGWQKQNRLAQIMSSCRYGLFPNLKDCSPRTIPECLLRNKPIMVNRKIWGGWHYVDENYTGAFFDSANSESVEHAIEIVRSSNLYPKDYFVKHFGFLRSSMRLAEILRTHYKQLEEFTHIYFKPYKSIMSEMLS